MFKCCSTSQNSTVSAHIALWPMLNGTLCLASKILPLGYSLWSCQCETNMWMVKSSKWIEFLGAAIWYLNTEGWRTQHGQCTMLAIIARCFLWAYMAIHIFFFDEVRQEICNISGSISARIEWIKIDACFTFRNRTDSNLKNCVGGKACRLHDDSEDW